MFCPECGAQNDDDAQYCCKCGLSLSAYRTHAEEVAQSQAIVKGESCGPGEQSSLKKNALPIVLIGVLAIASVTFVVIALTLQRTSAPVDTDESSSAIVDDDVTLRMEEQRDTIADESSVSASQSESKSEFESGSETNSMPAAESTPETTSELASEPTTESNDIKIYTGFYETTFDSGAAYGVDVSNQDGFNIEFKVEYVGANASPLYLTDVISAEVVNDEVDFEWTDSWNNAGTGHLRFGVSEVTISMVQTVTAGRNRATLSTEYTGDLVLSRIE